MGDSRGAPDGGTGDPSASRALPLTRYAAQGDTRLLHPTVRAKRPLLTGLPRTPSWTSLVSTTGQGSEPKHPPLTHGSMHTTAMKSKSQSSNVTALPTHATIPHLPLEMSAVLSKPQLQGQGVSRLLTFRSQYQPRAEGYAGEIIVITPREGWLRELRLI